MNVLLLRNMMLDRTTSFPPFRRQAVLLWHPAKHRRAAFLLRQDKDNPRAELLANHHMALAKHIQKRLNEGSARIAKP
jgi:hypothetical protein